MRICGSALAATLLAITLVPGQSSPSYRLEEHTFNAGGRPEAGLVAQSPSFAVTLDSLGDPLAARLMTGATLSLVTGPVWIFPPPIEVSGLLWTSPGQLIWNPAPTVEAYAVYRDSLSVVATSGGTCLAADLSTESHADPAEPASGGGFFYLVAATNRLAEEGSRGFRSDGISRPNAPTCP